MTCFYEHPQGTKETYYEIPYNIPPAGVVWDFFVGEWVQTEVWSRSDEKSEQYWERPVKDFDYTRRRKLEKQKQESNEFFVDAELEAFREQEWRRRINGFWFMNNGVPTFITGTHYLYLTWWRIDVGYPQYRHSDRCIFCEWSYCEGDPNSYGLVEAARRRAGKDLPIDTEIPTPKGFVKMIDLKVGDYVFGAEGEPVKVSYKSPVYANNEFFLIEFNDKSSIKAGADHQWEVTTKADRKKFGARNAPRKVMTTKQLLEDGVLVGKEFNYQIDLPLPVQFEEKELPLDPYLFGCWLGDGGKTNPVITNVDEHILDKFREQFSLKQTKSDEITYYIGDSGNGKFRTALSSMGFLAKEVNKKITIQEKQIPEIYKTASAAQRLELLKGIMDTDGCRSSERNNACELSVSNNELLANDYLEIIRSLGIRATLSKGDSYITRKDGTRDFCGYRYRIYLTPDNEIFSLGRKKYINRTKETQQTHKVRRITSITPTQSVPSQCIEVDSERSVYLTTRDYILTHNTFRSTVCVYESPSRTVAFDNFAGIQSKTRPDASKVFSKLINAFRALPDFFVPVYDTSAGTRPKTSLTFLEKSMKKKDGHEAEDVLGCSINYESYENLAYDGTKLIRYLRDEAGKTTLADVYQGWSIVKPCLTVGTRTIVGKALYTTTIEEGGSIAFKRLWDNSCFAQKDPNTQRTRTGLYRTFSPAFKNDADFIDAYGNCDEEASREAMLYERAALAADPKALADYIRKNPFDIKEAFYSINDDCIFDSLKINKQIDAIAYIDEKELFVRGNLRWTNGIGSSVEFVENFNGRWKIHAKFLEAAKKRSALNGWERVGDRFKPNSKLVGLTGADTFDHSKKNLADDKAASDAAFYTYIRHDPMNEAFSDTFVCEYIFRQPTADLMSEDLLMQCVFFGTQCVIENSKPGAISFFERNGYKDFIVSVDGRQGISPSVKNKQSGAECIEDYINNNIGNVVFQNLLLDWNLFSLENSTKFDAAMASMWTLLVATRIGKKFVEKPEHLRKKPASDAARIYRRRL